jgi:hypothetical protein
MINEETWRPVEGFEDRYEVSNTGRIRSLARCNDTLKHLCWPEAEMKIQTLNNGYQYIKLRKPGIHKKFLIHRLVAFHFLPNEDDGRDYVNHKDKNRKNNHVSNLEFMTHQENCDHRDGKNCDEPF